GDADGRVHHQQHDVGLAHRGLRLAADLRVEGVTLAGKPAACVDHDEGAAPPLGFDLLAIACDARLLLDDRDATADDAVEQCRLADVRPADNRDYRPAHVRTRPASSAARSARPSVSTIST